MARQPSDNDLLRRLVPEEVDREAVPRIRGVALPEVQVEEAIGCDLPVAARLRMTDVIGICFRSTAAGVSRSDQLRKILGSRRE